MRHDALVVDVVVMTIDLRARHASQAREHRAQAAERQGTLGPQAGRHGIVAARLLGTVRGQQLTTQVGIRPEVVAMPGLRPSQQGDRRVASSEDGERGR